MAKKRVGAKKAPKTPKTAKKDNLNVGAINDGEKRKEKDCRARWTATGKPSKRKTWFRSPESRARFARAMRAAAKKRK